jgi:hypothetical protein
MVPYSSSQPHKAYSDTVSDCFFHSFSSSKALLGVQSSERANGGHFLLPSHCAFARPDLPYTYRFIYWKCPHSCHRGAVFRVASLPSRIQRSSKFGGPRIHLAVVYQMALSLGFIRFIMAYTLATNSYRHFIPLKIHPATLCTIRTNSGPF